MEKYINLKKAVVLLAVLVLYGITITPLLIINLQNKRDLQVRAQIISAPTPSSAPTVLPTITKASSASISATVRSNIYVRF